MGKRRKNGIQVKVQRLSKGLEVGASLAQILADFCDGAPVYAKELRCKECLGRLYKWR